MEHPEISPARNESNIIRRVQGLPSVLQGVGLIAGSETRIAMRLMRGCSIEAVVTRRRQQPYDCCWMQLLTKQLCLAVSGLHQRGVAWRDAALGNVQLTGAEVDTDPGVVVFDFSVSVLRHNGPHLDPSKVPPTGTPAYMAPDICRTYWAQVLGNDPVPLGVYDAFKADAWGVGALLYYAATGQQLLPDMPSGGTASATSCSPSSTTTDCQCHLFGCFRKCKADGTGKDAVKSDDPSNVHSTTGILLDAEADSYIETWEWVKQCHSKWQAEGMQQLWDVLMDRTHDPKLLGLVKRLLALDPNERCTVSEALADPYLAGVEGQAPTVWWHHGVPMPQPAAGVPACAPLLPGSLLPEMGSCEGLHMIPGLHHVTWRPDAPPFCSCDTGPIHRAWVWDGPRGWQNCMLKIASWPAPADATATSDGGEASKPSDGAVAERMAEINTGTRACLDVQGCSGVPGMECAYADRQHFTLRRLPPGPISSLQDYFQARSSPHPLPALNFKQTARSLLQMLAGLHRGQHCLGCLLPERILVEPQLLLLDFCKGDWADSLECMRYLDPDVLRLRDNMQDVSTPTTDLWSLGVLLYDLATGHPPFIGELKSGRPVTSADDLSRSEKVEFWASIREEIEHYKRAPLEAELVGSVGQQAADVVLSLLTPHPPDRLSAEAALQLPFFLPEALQPSDSSLAVAEGLQQSYGPVSGDMQHQPVLLSLGEVEASQAAQAVLHQCL